MTYKVQLPGSSISVTNGDIEIWWSVESRDLKGITISGKPVSVNDLTLEQFDIIDDMMEYSLKYLQDYARKLGYEINL